MRAQPTLLSHSPDSPTVSGSIDRAPIGSRIIPQRARVCSAGKERDCANNSQQSPMSLGQIGRVSVGCSGRMHRDAPLRVWNPVALHPVPARGPCEVG